MKSIKVELYLLLILRCEANEKVMNKVMNKAWMICMVYVFMPRGPRVEWRQQKVATMGLRLPRLLVNSQRGAQLSYFGLVAELPYLEEDFPYKGKGTVDDTTDCIILGCVRNKGICVRFSVNAFVMSFFNNQVITLLQQSNFCPKTTNFWKAWKIVNFYCKNWQFFKLFKNL